MSLILFIRDHFLEIFRYFTAQILWVIISVLALLGAYILFMSLYSFVFFNETGLFGWICFFGTLAWFGLVIFINKLTGWRQYFGLLTAASPGILVLLALGSLVIQDSRYEPISLYSRQAENIESIYICAANAGVPFEGDSVEETIQNIVTGNTVDDPKSPFDGAYFGYSSQIDDTSLKSIAEYLEIVDGKLIHKPKP